MGPAAQVSALLRAPLVRCSRPFASPILDRISCDTCGSGNMSVENSGDDLSYGI